MFIHLYALVKKWFRKDSPAITVDYTKLTPTKDEPTGDYFVLEEIFLTDSTQETRRWVVPAKVLSRQSLAGTVYTFK